MSNEAALLLYSETMPDKIKRSLMSEIGKKGCQVKSEKKTAAARANAKKPRPRKKDAEF